MEEFLGGAAAGGPQEVPAPAVPAASPPVQEVVANLQATDFQLELQDVETLTPGAALGTFAGVPEVVATQEDRIEYHKYTSTIHDHYSKTTNFLMVAPYLKNT